LIEIAKRRGSANIGPGFGVCLWVISIHRLFYYTVCVQIFSNFKQTKIESGWENILSKLYSRYLFYLFSGIELFLILVFFLNALLVLLQQRNDLDRGNAWNSQYVQTAFIIESISLGLALGAVLLLLVGLGQNSAALLLPHLTIQVNCNQYISAGARG
jgi:hypothetical protein